MNTPLLKIQDIMSRLQLSRATVYRLIDQGHLTPRKFGRSVRFLEDELELFMQKARPKQDRARFVFTVKESGDGTPFLAAEQLDKGLSRLDNAHLYFDLRPGTSFEEAQALARTMRDKIEGIFILDFDPETLANSVQA